MKYGIEPIVMDHYDLSPTEMCFIQYLPIKLINTDIRIPENIHWTIPLIAASEYNDDDYVYLTVKYLYVTPENMGNRPGWHSDGFDTDDINYIWYDSHPTEFCIQDFNISDDHNQSMIDMGSQAQLKNIRSYGIKNLIKMDKFSIHRVPVVTTQGYRAFVKISVSKHKYNLKGNAHNYLFDYNWDMKERTISRNHPIG